MNPIQSKTLETLLGIGILILVCVVFFSPLLFDGKAIFYRDFSFITYPTRHYLAQAYHQGVIPYWTESTNNGTPFMAAFHPGVFYPPSLILFLKDTTLALNLFYVFHYLIMGVFVFLLARLWGLSLAAGLASAITGMLSGFLIASTLLSNLFIAAVWLPMVFWFFHKFMERKHPGYFIGFVLAIASQTLAACPEISVMTMVLLFIHYLWFMPKTSTRGDYAKASGYMIGGTLLALGLCALQLVPTFKLIQLSLRQGGFDFEYHATWSTTPIELLTLLLNPDFRQFLTTTNSHPFLPSLLGTLYMGILGITFVLFGFFFRKDKRILFWLLMFWGCLYLSMGNLNIIYEWIYPWIPFLNKFRYPEKYFFISSFAVLFLLGYGIDCLIRHTQERTIKVTYVISVLLVLFGAIATATMAMPVLKDEYVFAIMLVFGFIYILFYFRKIKAAWFAGFIVVMIFMDLAVKGFQMLPLIDKTFYEEKPLLMDILGDSRGKYRVYSGRIREKPKRSLYPKGAAPHRVALTLAAKQHLYPFSGMVYGVEHVDGMPGLALDLKHHMDWISVLIVSSPQRRMRILERSNVKYWVDGDSLTLFNTEGHPLILPDRVKVLENALPRAYLVPKVRQEESKRLPRIYYSKEFDPRAEVLVSDPMEFTASDHFEGKVEEVTYRPNHVTVKTTQQGNGVLVLMDTYFPGWTVKVDGKEEKIWQVNHFYRGVKLGPGSHTLEFDYFPEGFKTGLIISAVSLFILLAFPLCTPRKRPQIKPAASEPAATAPESPEDPSPK
ncbi:MAG: YfhO family protein [Nitrospinaceae bacterium]|nr:YfhO family protein [Nitrospinaceae bacterium]NIS88254.1 YfhO family protein [Nitrospinaceae bacterium]NIU99496.1 YfhO family protein [Nitrospinaceae bacterium]